MTTAQQAQDRLITRRDYLHVHAILAGASMFMAREAVSSVALEHPEWDLDGATDTFAGWERRALAAHDARRAAAAPAGGGVA